MQDLLSEFHKIALQKKAEFQGLMTGGRLSHTAEKCMEAIEKCFQSHLKSERNCEFTLKQMLEDFNARLFKPQRLCEPNLCRGRDQGLEKLVPF